MLREIAEQCTKNCRVMYKKLHVTFADFRILYGLQKHLDADAERHLLSSSTQLDGYFYDSDECAFKKT